MDGDNDDKSQPEQPHQADDGSSHPTKCTPLGLRRRFAGLVHHFASGDFYESSQPGLLAAGGVELFRESTFNVTLELSYDASKIKLNLVPSGTTSLRSYETVFSVFIKF